MGGICDDIMGSAMGVHPQYLETAHSRLLDHKGAVEPDVSFVDALNATINLSPYGAYEVVEPDEGFFGVRTDDPNLLYEIKNFPSLWDVFGKFMGGLDVHDLWAQIYEDVVQGPELENVISAHSALVQDDIDTKVLPKFLAGMRDIGSVHSTAFIIGQAIIQTSHVKAVNKFSSAIRLHGINVATNMWTKHLDWDNMVMTSYSEIFKLYYAARMDIDGVNLEYQAKDKMWDINLFENARAILGAVAGGSAATAGQNEPSQRQKAIGGAMTGAAAGFMIGGPVGAVIGGFLGLAASFF